MCSTSSSALGIGKFFLLVFGLLVDVQQYFIVALMCICLMDNDVEHLFMWLVDIHISSLHILKLGWLFSYCGVFKSSSYILHSSLLLHVRFEDSSPSLQLIFSFCYQYLQPFEHLENSWFKVSSEFSVCASTGTMYILDCCPPALCVGNVSLFLCISCNFFVENWTF